MLDIVAFVQRGDFPRSRLGEKQRGKILASWVSRKMQTIAQFSIRDPDAEGSVGTAVPEEDVRRGSGQSGKGVPAVYKGSPGSLRRAPGTRGSSLRHVESISQIPVVEEPREEFDFGTPPRKPSESYFVPPSAFDEYVDGRDSRSDATPTNERPRPLQVNTALNTTLDYSPIDGEMYDSPDRSRATTREPSFEMVHPPHLYQPEQRQMAPAPTATYLDYSPISPNDAPMVGGGGGLRIANPTDENSDDWSHDALRHLNLER